MERTNACEFVGPLLARRCVESPDSDTPDRVPLAHVGVGGTAPDTSDTKSFQVSEANRLPAGSEAEEWRRGRIVVEVADRVGQRVGGSVALGHPGVPAGQHLARHVVGHQGGG